MSQGSNFKKEVMEALFNAPTNLITNKAIMWAASNLPDEGGKGRFETEIRGEYRHDSDSFWHAVGMPDQDMEKIHDKFRDTFIEYGTEKAPDGGFTKSQMFEYIENKLGAEGMMFMAVHGFMDFYNGIKNAQKASEVDDIKDIPDDAPDAVKSLLKHLIELKKRLGGDK